MTMPERHEDDWDGVHTVDAGLVRNQEYIEQRAAELTGHDKATVKAVFDACWDAIRDELEVGNTVKLHGKGRFYLSRRSSRIGRNPQTKEQYHVPEREAMAFQNSQAYAKKLREVRRQRLGLPPEDVSPIS